MKLILFLKVGYGFETTAHKYGNIVDDLLDNLKEAVDYAISVAQNALDAANAQLDALALKFEAEADKQITASEKLLVDELEKLKALAKEKNVTITECLGANEENLVNLPARFHKSLVNCTDGITDEGTKYVQGALDKVRISVLLFII